MVIIVIRILFLLGLIRFIRTLDKSILIKYQSIFFRQRIIHIFLRYIRFFLCHREKFFLSLNDSLLINSPLHPFYHRVNQFQFANRLWSSHFYSFEDFRHQILFLLLFWLFSVLLLEFFYLDLFLQKIVVFFQNLYLEFSLNFSKGHPFLLRVLFLWL